MHVHVKQPFTHVEMQNASRNDSAFQLTARRPDHLQIAPDRANRDPLGSGGGCDVQSGTGKQFVEDATDIAQFMDRDTRPDVASAVLLPAIQQFLADPVGAPAMLRTVEGRRKDFF
jgi:hypothetical protein